MHVCDSIYCDRMSNDVTDPGLDGVRVYPDSRITCSPGHAQPSVLIGQDLPADSASGDRPRRVASAVQVSGSLAMHAGGSGLTVGSTHDADCRNVDTG
jgi:hypothetical protein